MRLSLSVAAKSNSFSKAIRRIRPKFESLFSEFEAMKLVNPIHEAILLGITDSMGSDELEVVPNKDGFFQVICGFDVQTELSLTDDGELEARLFKKIQNTVELCPFSQPDKVVILDLLHSWSSRELRGSCEA